MTAETQTLRSAEEIYQLTLQVYQDQLGRGDSYSTRTAKVLERLLDGMLAPPSLEELQRRHGVYPSG